ncbi:HDOD domain-containing protein [Marinomonas algicola]|uniref:HDOD domain-containing protein n=1 Tax=Marinomonas algicola TaxID=2773454 RepID=UPI00174E0CC1|nr:HDOD domain-containing protein [Marinomonas algicola]
MSDKSPFGLEEWLTFLQSKKLPVSAGNYSRLKKQVKSPDETLDKLQSNISSEPFLAFTILSEANKVVSNKRADIKTPNHAASMVGMDGLSKVLNKLEPCKYSAKDPAHQHFLRQVQISYEAASIAKRWAIEKRINNSEDIFWVTFFRDAIRWMMWFYAEPKMSLMVKLLKDGKTLKAAEESSIGCRLDELAVKVFQIWQIPHIIINSFLTDHIPNPKELQSLASLASDPDEMPGYTEDRRLTILANSPLLLAFCATKVAHMANNMNWGTKNINLYYQVISCVLHCKQGKVIQATHYAAVEAAQLYNHSDKIPIACQLLSPTLYVSKEIQRHPAQPSPPQQPSKIIGELYKNYTGDKKELIREALKTIKIVIPNAQHALVLVSKHPSNKIAPALQFGYDLDVLKKIDWNSPSAVLSHLAQKQSVSNLPSPKLKTTIAKFPLSAQQILDERGHLFIGSCPQKLGSSFIIWLDTRSTFNDNDYTTFKTIILTLSKALAKA